MAFLEVRNLGKSYGQAEILKGINLSVEKGEILGLIGPTGSGKTTLLRLIDLLEEPGHGSILLEGREVSGWPEKERIAARRRMGMVFQKPVMFKSTVLENVSFGLLVRGKEEAKQREEKARRALQSVGLSGYEGRDANTLSGGEMQRIALARAIVPEPELLLLDEPTEGLAPALVRALESQIKRLRDSGLTVLLAEQNVKSALRLSDRGYIIDNGQIRYEGAVLDLRENEEVRKKYLLI